MEGLIPWQQLEESSRSEGDPPPLSAWGDAAGHHCVQLLFYNVSDPGMEDLLYEVESVRRFAGLRLSGSLPDETTILNFRRSGVSRASEDGDDRGCEHLTRRSTKNRRGKPGCTRRRRET